VTVEITRVDPAELDLTTADELSAIDNAALEDVPLRQHTAETFLLECRDRNGEGPDAGFWLAHDHGRLLGYAALTLNLFENLDGAKILGAVHPDEQRRGIGRLLMEAAEAATDRPRLRAPAWSHTAGEMAVPHFGYARQGSHEVRRLEVRAPRPPELLASAEQASGDYELERFCGRCPDQLLRDLQTLRETINDAPGLGADYEAFPPNRIRGYEESLAGRRQTPYTIVARDRTTGEAAGITMLCVHELRPAIAAQEDTSVVARHRGRRLGLRMKLAMLDWLGAERPDVESVDTWNVPDNAPMIAINDALGCRKVAETIAFRKTR
jgi:GNAT superfamily N-acetyltransferase